MPGTNGGIPPNIVWDEDNPPVKNTCCGLVQVHDPKCDGTCITMPCTELEVDLLNENRNWARLGMTVDKVPHSAWRIQNQIDAIIQYLILEDVDAKEQLDIQYQLATVNRMRVIREANEQAIKRAALGLPPKPNILGPDGKPLG